MAKSNRLPKLLTEDELCAYIGKSKAWAQRARLEGTGPPFVKAGRKPLYPATELDKWLRDTMTTSTNNNRPGNPSRYQG